MNEQTMIDLVNKIADNDKVAPFQNGYVVLTNQEMVKLVELIVQECMDIVSPYAVRMENFDGGHPIADLKKHFGVEE